VISRRVPFAVLLAFLCLTYHIPAKSQTSSSPSGDASKEALRKACDVDAAESSGDLTKMNAALTCIEREKEKQRHIRELKKTIEKSLETHHLLPTSESPVVPPATATSSSNPVEGKEVHGVNSKEVKPAPAAAPPAPDAGNSPVPSPNTAGQVLRDSAYNTPTACDSSSQASGGDSNGVIAVHRTLLVPKEASDDFGYRLGRRFIVYKVSVTNTSTTFQYSIADISVDLKEILTSMGAVPGANNKYPRFLASGHDLTLLRGIPEKGMDYDPRNMTLHILQGIGSVAAGVSGLTPFADVMGPAVANFNGAFLQAFVGIAPDHTATQLNRLSDMAFSPNNLLDKMQTKTFAVFIPESLLLENHDQDLFWKNPRQLLDIYPFDLVDVCTDGQLLTPAAIASVPKFSPDGGNISPTATITLAAPGTDAIYYTLDGSVPSTTSPKYAKPFPVNTTIGGTTTVEAFATAANQVQSPVMTRVFTTQPQAAMPTFQPLAGVVTANASVTISTTTPGATIYYTTDGTNPTVGSVQYTGPISVTPPETVKAIAISPGTSLSDVASAQYTATAQAVTPTFSPVAGAIAANTSVTISTTTAGATIYYTTDGTAPTVDSTQYTWPISVTPPKTLKAIAISSATSASDVGTAQYSTQQ
jgi:Chitobiase/beta-hexosaminidase C-terminal domain